MSMNRRTFILSTGLVAAAPAITRSSLPTETVCCRILQKSHFGTMLPNARHRSANPEEVPE